MLFFVSRMLCFDCQDVTFHIALIWPGCGGALEAWALLTKRQQWGLPSGDIQLDASTSTSKITARRKLNLLRLVEKCQEKRLYHLMIMFCIPSTIASFMIRYTSIKIALRSG